MPKRKTTFFVTLLVFLLGIVGFIIGFYIYLPIFLQKKISGFKSSLNTDMLIMVSGVTIRGAWVKFHDVSICSKNCGKDDPVVLKLKLLRLKPSLKSIVTGKLEFSRVELSGVRLKIDIQSPTNIDEVKNMIFELNNKWKNKEDVRSNKKLRGNFTDVSMSDFGIQIFLPGGIKVRTIAFSNIPIKIGKQQEISFGNVDISADKFHCSVKEVDITISPSHESLIPEIKRVVLVEPDVRVSLLHIPFKFDYSHGSENFTPKEGENKTHEHGGVISKSVRFWKSFKEDFESYFSQISSFIERIPVEFISCNFTLNFGENSEKSWQFSNLNGIISYDNEKKRVEFNTTGNFNTGISKESTLLPFSFSSGASSNNIEMNISFSDFELIDFSSIGIRNQLVDFSNAKMEIEGDLNVDFQKNEIFYDGNIGLRNFTVNHYRIASVPVTGISLSLNGKLHLKIFPFSLESENLGLVFNGIPVAVDSFHFEEGEDENILKIQGELPPLDCQKLFSAIPVQMRENLSGFHFGGVMGLRFDFYLDLNKPEDAIIDFKVSNQCEVKEGREESIEKFSHSFVYNVEDKLGKHQFLTGPETDNWVSLEEIPKNLINAVITSEDGAFYHHSGVSAFAVKRAIRKDLEAKGFIYGASTITMQLVKNLFLSREKTVARKLQEMILSWWLERSMNKDRIMELYLNVIEYGPEIYGIKNASFHYFGKEPQDLNLMECIFLVKMLPNPVARYRYFEKARDTGSLPSEWRAVLEKTAMKMFQRGYISKEEYDESLKQDLNFFKNDIPEQKDEQ